MPGTSDDKDLESIQPLLADLFTIDAVYRQRHRLILSLGYRYERSRTEALLKDRLRLSGHRFDIEARPEAPLILSIDLCRRLTIPPVNIALFVATLCSVYVVPVFLRHLPAGLLSVAPSDSSVPLSFTEELRLLVAAFPLTISSTLTDLRAGAGIEFTAAIISILFVHEMGHFLASRRRGIITTWPYFIPAPNIIGTFGAIIKSKSPFWNRRDLLEVGAAGPIAGWVVAMSWLVYGLAHSTLRPADAFGLGEMAFSLDGESLLVRLIAPILAGHAGSGSYYHFTEAAFAGWVGLLITAINLLPIGQLDGGHVMYGLLPRKQKLLGWMATFGLLLLGFQSTVWWFFAAFGLLFRVSHPPTLDDARPPSKAALRMGIASLVILVLSFTPVPFR